MSKIHPSITSPKMVWAVIGILLVIFGVLSIAVGTYVLMKKFTASSFIYFKIHLYENYPQEPKGIFYPWDVTITASLLKTGHTRINIEIKQEWGTRYRQMIASFPQGFMINLYDEGFEIEQWEANIIHRKLKEVPLPDEPGWITRKVVRETPIKYPMRINVENKLFDMTGPTFIFHLDNKLNNIILPFSSLNEFYLLFKFQFISKEPLAGYNPLTGGQTRVYVNGEVGKYEFKGVGKEKSGDRTLPGLHLFASKREEQKIRTIFTWKSHVQGKFSAPEKMVGAKQFGEVALNEEWIKGDFVYEISTALWLTFLGAILGLPMCAVGGKLMRKYFRLLKEKREAGETPVQTKEIENQVKVAAPKKILILSANPKTTPRLRLDEEVREIEEGLKRARRREQFVIYQKWAVRLRDLRRALLDVEPQIVHFTGHGKKDGLLVEDELGFAVRISKKALSGLFELCAHHVECVILSACYSEKQAAAISKHINYVIGMRKEIKDKAAIEFAVGFYDALGAGKSVEQAFEFGRNAIDLKFPGVPGHLIPVLKRKPILNLKGRDDA